MTTTVKTGTTVCVVQPRILPPLYYLRRMLDADITVFLTSAQYTKKSRDAGGRMEFTGQSHFKLTHGWVGVPLFGKRRVPIDQVRLATAADRVEALARELRAHDEAGQWFLSMMRESTSLGDLGVRHVQHLMANLGLDVLTCTDREIGVTADEHQGADWMLAIAKQVGADTYLAGGSAVTHYLDPLEFEEAGVRVEVQRWNEETAPTIGVPGLSVIEWMRWAPQELQARLA